MENKQNPKNQIALFKGKTIRWSIYHKEWWFSILDIVKVLTDSPQPKTYWAKMKERDKEMEGTPKTRHLVYDGLFRLPEKIK